MPHYLQRGEVPRKRHTQFRGQDGALRYEELVSRKGFSDIYSNLYHLRMPTRMLEVGAFRRDVPEPVSTEHRARHIRTAKLASEGDAISARRLLFFNHDVRISKAHVDRSMTSIYRNGHHDELLYVQQGSGAVRTNFGSLVFGEGDYLVIPRGVLMRVEVDGPVRMLVVESRGAIETPSRYRNEHGQLLEHSPFCERDMRAPRLDPPVDRQGAFLVQVRLELGVQEYTYAHHPCDVVGWDGYYYPWAMNIRDFEPITGRIHQPPPVHQTFQAPGFVVCSFVSRLFDYHPEAVPAPYPHSNVDSDEILFYSWGEFMSRKGIELESITLHPMGLPHGPQPGKYEASIGKKATEELAVMIDTFAPLHLAESALGIDDASYVHSWLE
ncbi:MAG: homogentisate 1,2-dioxygenase [Polyangiaceae bacterium]|jgi:homogentisate 1,2-dioxygenase|nr:homogentisate 1,2-dioxygenase [Polyangiaceae bacterium]